MRTLKRVLSSVGTDPTKDTRKRKGCIIKIQHMMLYDRKEPGKKVWIAFKVQMLFITLRKYNTKMYPIYYHTASEDMMIVQFFFGQVSPNSRLAGATKSAHEALPKNRLSLWCGRKAIQRCWKAPLHSAHTFQWSGWLSY